MSYRLERDVATPMRDGIQLRADVYLPDSNGPFPTLVCRTPYDKSLPWGLPEYQGLVDAGYAVVAQDVRGRWASDGEFHPFFVPGWTDHEDGYDTVEWAAAQPWSSGKVGTFGNSYRAWTQWVLAPMKPPHLVAMWTGGMAPRITDFEMGGVFRTGRALQWLAGHMATDTRRSLTGRTGPVNFEEWTVAHESVDRDKWLWFLPLRDLPDEVVGGLRQEFHEWLKNHPREIWHLDRGFPDIDVPVFHRTGWYDRLNGAAEMFSGMQQSAGSEHARHHQRLIVGPWSHQTVNMSRVGEVDFGPDAEVDHMSLLVDWFDYWLKGVDNGVMDTPPARLFQMGTNRWLSADTWPPEGVTPTDFYLESGGSANTPQGDGVLAADRPADGRSDAFNYDPRDPVMTLYGANAHDEPRAQRVLDQRRDVLVYQTPPLDQALDVAGYPEVTLWASSTAPDTDFTAKLVDVHPDGFAQNLCYGLLRARYRNGFGHPEMLAAGEVYEFKIRLRPTCVRFLPGHRIRLDISSSDFPNFDRNHNTGRDDWADPELRTAHQTVLHDSAHPSRLTLPPMRYRSLA